MAGYRLNKLKEDTHVAYWSDPRGPGYGSLQRGTIASHIGDTVLIAWFEGENEGVVERWNSGDLRYRVDRGQAILTPPPKPRRIKKPKAELWCKTCGTRRDIGCECPRLGAIKPEHWGVTNQLTLADKDDSITISNDKDEGKPIQKGATPMAKTKAKKTTKVVDDDDFVELDEVEEDEEDEADDSSAGKLSAKEAATAIGTDARTLRKFLRKKAGKVGQGNRWLIDPDDLDDLKEEFEASTRSKPEADDDDEDKPKAKKATKKPKAKKSAPVPDEEIYGADEDDDEEDDEDEFEVLDEIDDL